MAIVSGCIAAQSMASSLPAQYPLLRPFVPRPWQLSEPIGQAARKWTTSPRNE
jgi:hypothetical protein